MNEPTEISVSEQVENLTWSAKILERMAREETVPELKRLWLKAAAIAWVRISNLKANRKA